MKMSKVVTVVQARMGSSRFPNKMLSLVHGKPLLQVLVERLSRATSVSDIVVATSCCAKDDMLAEYCRKQGVQCFRGSENDLLDRFYKAALKYQADVVVRICGDCLLIDPKVVDDMVSLYLKNQDQLDYLSNVEPLPTTYPDGMDVTIITTAALKRAWMNATKPSEREHVTFHFYNNPDQYRVKRVDLDTDLSAYRMCVDYEDDLKVMSTILKVVEDRKIDGTMEELVQIMDEFSLQQQVNNHYFGEGWKTSFQKDVAAQAGTACKAPPLKLDKSNALWEKVVRVIPGGAQTFSKMPYQHVEGVAPKFLVRGKGCKVWDLDDNEYIDSVLGLGAIVLGHCQDEIDEAVRDTACNYFNTPSLPHPLEYELACILNEVVPCSEMVRYAKNGSDVTSAAVRLSRHVTGKEVIGCTGYHGWHEWYIGATQRHAGIPARIRELTKVFSYNDRESVEKLFKENKGNVAALVLEPVNFEAPENDFLHYLKEICAKNGALLVFDEVVTGFRIGLGGAQQHYGVIPDLACVGKSIANGYPLSALCGKADYMKEFKDVFFSGTFGGEITSIAAAIQMIRFHQRYDVSGHMNRMGEMLLSGLRQLAEELSVPYFKSSGFGWWPKYGFDAVSRYSSLQLLTLFQQELVKRGVLTRSTVFLCYDHDVPHIRTMLQAMREALMVVKNAVDSGTLVEQLEGKVIEPVIRDENIKH